MCKQILLVMLFFLFAAAPSYADTSTIPVFQILDQADPSFGAAHNVFNVFFTLQLVTGLIACGLKLTIQVFTFWR